MHAWIFAIVTTLGHLCPLTFLCIDPYFEELSCMDPLQGEVCSGQDHG